MRLALGCILLLLAGCHRTTVPTRIIHLEIAVGPDLRRQPDWRDRIASRVRAASEIFRPFNLQLDVAAVSEWEPDAAQPAERNRWRLGGYHSSGDWLELGFFGSVKPGEEPGLSVPFDPRLIVSEIAGAPETEQAAALAHDIGHVFGAWHPRESGSVMSLPPGNKFDSDAADMLAASHAMDLREGARSLSAEAVARIQKLWADAKAEPSTNPFYRFYAATGTEQYVRGQRGDAQQSLGNALKYGPDVAKAHIEYGNSLLATGDYTEAADEFRKAAKLDSRSAAAQSGLGAALIGSGHREEGMQTLATNVRMNPGDPAAHANLGVVLTSMPGHLDDGIAELREALRINPNFEAAKRSLDAALQARTAGRK